MAEHTMDVDQGGGRERRVPVDYPSNSKNPNPNPEPEGVRPPVEKIVTGRVTRKKTYGGTFVSDTLRSIGQYVWTDVMLPSLRDMLYDTISGGAHRGLYGSGQTRTGSRTSYNSRFTRPGTTAPQNPYTTSRTVSSTRSTHKIEEIILEDRDTADAVLEALQTLVADYKQASVADLFTLCDINTTFIDAQWGWTDREIGNFRIIPTRGGYLLKTPATVPVAS